jgi:hypothetical protein
MHTVHNARIQLLATACNNLGLAVIVATLIAPAIGGQQVHFFDVGLGLAWNHPTSGGPAGAWETATMTWDQTLTWLIWPAFVTLGIAIAAVVASRYIP